MLQGEDIVFRVSVISKGKSSGRNKNYLNVRYSDGSLGGVFINKHQWSFISKVHAERIEKVERKVSVKLVNKDPSKRVRFITGGVCYIKQVS